MSEHRSQKKFIVDLRLALGAIHAIKVLMFKFKRSPTSKFCHLLLHKRVRTRVVVITCTENTELSVV